MVKQPIKYTGEACEKCKRVRVEIYNNGDSICEKCGWNTTTKEYESLDQLFDEYFEDKHSSEQDYGL